MKYEIQILAKDKTKVIRFAKNGKESVEQQPKLWDDFFYALGAVIDDEAEIVRDETKVIGILNVKDSTSFEEIIDIMCEELQEQYIKIIANQEETSIIDVNP